MDKYEFRGRSKQTGRWLFGDLIRIDRCVFIAPFDVFWRDFIDCRETNPIHTPYDVYEVFPSTVGQFTGITDKDGIKIYEGDIVECVSWNDFFTNPDTGEVMEPFRRKVYIELRNGGFKMIEKMPEPLEDRVWDIIPFSGDITIVGNMADNPELVKPKKLTK